MSEIGQVDYDELEIPTIDYDRIITEDDAPMDNLFSERQMDLLKESLYTSWPGPGDGRPFVVMTNVGLFFAEEASPLVPDVLVSLDVELPADPFPKPHRSYFIWRYGKPPDIVVEIVSNRKGRELGDKLLDYARLGAAYYIVYDPEQHLDGKPVRIFSRQSTIYREQDDTLLADIGLGVMLWHGHYQGMVQTWLRWCDRAGNMLLTGDERTEQERQRAEQEYQRAEQERQRAERLAEKLRALGVDPDA
jgi:Uma2 family endonuclease